MMCMSGPPCMPGKTCRSTAFASPSAHRTKPPRGPRSVLCVVDVTMSACGTGLGCDAAGHEPGDVRHVHDQARLDLARDVAERLEVDDAGYALAPGNDHLRPVLPRQIADLVVVDAPVRAHPVRDA
jgi:hypothetical protein